MFYLRRRGMRAPAKFCWGVSICFFVFSPPMLHPDMMSLSISIFLLGANVCHNPIIFTVVSRFDLRHVSHDSILMPCLYGCHLSDDILLSTWMCEGFRSHMCDLNAELATPRHGLLSARALSVQLCGATERRTATRSPCRKWLVTTFLSHAQMKSTPCFVPWLWH